jgi:M6 family metalloprotease-like protein
MTALAVPANHDSLVTLRQPDGSTFSARLSGDERAHWYETGDHETVLRRGDGWWTYAEKTPAGAIAPSTSIVGLGHPPATAHIRQDAALLAPVRSRRLESLPREAKLQAIIDTAHVVMILVQFTDTPQGEGAQGPHTPQYFSDPATGLVLGSQQGRMTDYFEETPYGQLTIDGVVANAMWHNSAQSESHYGDDCDPGACGGADSDNCSGCIYELAREAVHLADAAGFDFSQYDADADGVVDHVLIIHAGRDQAGAGGVPADIWSHRWVIPGGEPVDGKSVEGYTMLSEFDAMNVFAHEFAHDLGAPDPYDYDYDSEPVGRWCLMASNVGSDRPPHLCGLLKYDLDADFQNGIVGWASATQLASGGSFSVGQLDANRTGSVYITTPAFAGNERFVVENRQRTGFYDWSVPEQGIVFTHVDMDMPDGNGAFNDGPPANTYHGAWVERPGNATSADGAAWSADDAETAFTPLTVPATDANDGGATGLYFTGIGNEAGIMSVQFSPSAPAVGEGVSAPFALYLGPGFVPPTPGGVGSAVSAAFALYLGPLGESFAVSPPFALDTRLPAAFTGTVRAVGPGTPVAGATVQLYLGSAPQQATSTDGSGRYQFYSIIFGDYVVRAAKTGFAMGTSDLLRYQGGGPIEADVSLPPLSGAPQPDLAVVSSDLTYTVLQSGALTLTAMIHNNGGVAASNVRVRFYDASTGTGVGDYVAITPDVVLSDLAAGEAKPASVTWTPPSGHQRFYVFADPDDEIQESDPLNNAALRDLGVLGRVPPRVTAVAAQYDGLADPHLIGRFLTGIENAMNKFAASVTDLDGDVERVRFDFGGTIVEDTSPEDGWSVMFDVGSLPAGNIPLSVTAYDAAGLASEPCVAMIVMDARPTWLVDRLSLDLEIPVRIDVEPGYLTFRVKLKNEEFPGEPFLFFEDIIDPDVLIVGSLRTSVKFNLYLDVSCPFQPGAPWKLGGAIKRTEKVLGRPEQEHELSFKAVVSPDGLILESITIEFSEDLVIPTLPEIPSPPLFVSGIRVEVGISMDTLLRAHASAMFAGNLESFDIRFVPQVGAQINGVLRVSDPIKFARLELILSPRFLMGPDLRYVYPPGDMTLGGEFTSEIRGRIVGSLIWGIVSKTLLTFGWGPWEWTYPRTGLAAGPTLVATLAQDSLNVPGVFPYPSAASSATGEIGAVWVSDVDPSLSRVDPEVFFSSRDTTGVWSAPARLTSNDRFETIPLLAYLPDGRAVVVWVQSSLLESEATPTMSLSQILDRQDIWWAVRDSLGWSAPLPLVEDATPLFRADGLPALASTGDGAVLLWSRSMGDSALAVGSGEIFAAAFSDSGWSGPARLTDDQADDAAPAVCSTGPEAATAAWLREDPPGSGDQRIVWSGWDGSSWSAQRVLRDAGRKTQGPALAATSDGITLASWVEIETLADSTLLYHLVASAKAAADTAWGPMEEVFADSQFVETPSAFVDLRNIAVITWRGHDGYDGDLFAALKDLDDPGAPWTLPRSVTADTLTDWMATAALDDQNNLHFIDLKTDLADTTGAEAPSNFFGGLNIVSRGITNDLALDDELNFGFRPLSADLMMRAGSIWLDAASPVVEDTVAVSARVENIGDVRADATTVRFYEGHPDSGGVPFPNGDVALASIAPDSSAVVVAEWVVSEGAVRLYARVDPEGGVDEQNEGNNLALVEVNVRPDLEAIALSVSNPNPVPGDSVLVTAVVGNAGGAQAAGFSVRFDSGSGTLGTVPGLSLSPGEIDTVSVSFAAAAGADTLSCVADPDSALADSDRSNNVRTLEFLVLPDLAVVADSLRYVSADTSGTLSAYVLNAGGVASDASAVAFYRGNPLAGGVLLGTAPLAVLPAGAGAHVGLEWQAPVGLSTIYAVADDGEAICERDEGNNESFVDVIRSVQPDLAVIPGSISAHIDSAGAVTLAAAVANVGAAHALAVGVEFFRGDPDSGGALIDARLLTAIDFGDTTAVSVSWASPDSVENHVFVVVDRAGAIAEINEANNRASKRFGPLTYVAPPHAAPPVRLALYANQPNPFSARTLVRFDLPAAGPVALAVYDVAGRLVRRLLDRSMPAGSHSAVWDGTDEGRRRVASGIYFCRLQTHEGTLARKLALLE